MWFKIFCVMGIIGYLLFGGLMIGAGLLNSDPTFMKVLKYIFIPWFWLTLGLIIVYSTYTFHRDIIKDPSQRHY